DGVIGGQDDGPIAGDYRDDQPQEDLPGGEAGPGIAVQDAVVVGEVPLLPQAHGPQGGTDGAIADGQEGPDGEGLGLDPGAVGEQRCEGSQEGYHLGRQVHGVVSTNEGASITVDRGQRPPGPASQLGQSRVTEAHPGFLTLTCK